MEYAIGLLGPQPALCHGLFDPLNSDRSAKGWRQSSRDGGDYRGESSILLGLSGEGAVERGAVHAQLLGDLPS